MPSRRKPEQVRFTVKELEPGRLSPSESENTTITKPPSEETRRLVAAVFERFLRRKRRTS